VPALIVGSRLRQLLRLGYGADDIAAALRIRYERQREEFQFAYGPKVGIRERVIRIGGFTAIAAGAAAVIAILAGGPADSLGPLAAFSTYGGVLATALSSRWRRLRRGAGSRWAKLWQGKPGRLFERVAGTKLGVRAIPERSADGVGDRDVRRGVVRFVPENDS
jgi:hypothetical protein